LTHLLLKPFSGQTLLKLLESLHLDSLPGPVLIVDDDPNALTLYQRLASEALPGYSVISAEGGAQALEILEREIPNLIILDLMMPHIDGFTVLERTRLNPRTRKVPVVVMSGKMLTYEDVKRLDYPHVTYQIKGILSSEEAVASLQKSSSGEAALCQPTSVLAKYTLAYLQQNFAQQFSRKELAAAVGVSENYLSQIFRQEMGVTPWECLLRLRIQKAKELLLNSKETVTSVATRVGFNDPAYFSRVFRKLSDQSPQTYRQKAV
jgi:YesN/AraC family two-component response regulator